MKSIERTKTHAQTCIELFSVLTQNGRWWMLPMLLVLALTSLLLTAVAAVEYVAPFVYTIF